MNNVPTITIKKRFSCVEAFNAWTAKRAYRTTEAQRDTVESVAGVCNIYTPNGDGSFEVSRPAVRMFKDFTLTVSAHHEVLSVKAAS